jgi:hypothetical protein
MRSGIQKIQKECFMIQNNPHYSVVLSGYNVGYVRY